MSTVQPQLIQTSRQRATNRLAQEAAASQEILFKARTVFPLVLFPDTVVVDRAKLSITRSFFFGHSQTVSIQIEDILDATASCGPFFGSVRMRTRYFTEKNLVIKCLSRSDACRLKDILQGYVIALKKELEINAIPTAQLIPMLEQLGRDTVAEAEG